MRRTLSPLALLLVASQAALAQDLAGHYRVSGDLPGPGGEYGGVALITASGASSYRVRVVARTEEGRTLRLSGSGRVAGEGRLEVRYRALGGSLAGALEGGPALVGLVGRYRLGADGALSGRLSAAGVTPAGRARYVREAPAPLTFSPATLEVAPGDEVVASLAGPAEALALTSVRCAGGSARLSGDGATRRVRVTGLAPGQHVVTASVGSTAVARLQVSVRAPSAPVIDVVADEVARVRAAGQLPVVVFDLDDTLFETRTRSAVIIQEYARANGDDPRLLAARPEHTRFGLEQTLEQVGLTPAEISGDLGRAIRRFWSPRFFNGTHYRHDTPIAGAADYVNRLHGLGAKIVYLTGRKEQARQPSLDALAAAGFPVDPATTTIFVKPNVAPGQPKLETAAWKGETLRTEIAAMGTVVAAFDNEPANCNALRSALPPPTRVIFLDTLYADDAPGVVAEIATIEDYR